MHALFISIAVIVLPNDKDVLYILVSKCNKSINLPWFHLDMGSPS